jgi:hypothetical protein
MKRIYILIILLALNGGLIFSQDISAKKFFKWNLSFTAGKYLGGPSHSLERAMIIAGFNAPTLSMLTHSYIIYPLTETTISPESWSMEVDRSINNNLVGGICFSGTEPTETFGHTEAGEYLDIIIKMKSISPVIMYNFKHCLLIGGGPALNYIYSRTYVNNGFHAKSTIGLILKTSVSVPAKTRIFVKAEMQGRLAGKQKIGPIDINGAVFPESKIDMNYFYFGIGIGIRLIASGS